MAQIVFCCYAGWNGTASGLFLRPAAVGVLTGLGLYAFLIVAENHI